MTKIRHITLGQETLTKSDLTFDTLCFREENTQNAERVTAVLPRLASTTRTDRTPLSNPVFFVTGSKSLTVKPSDSSLCPRNGMTSLTDAKDAAFPKRPPH